MHDNISHTKSLNANSAMEALYKGCPIRPDLLTNMSTTAIVVADWLISKIYTQPIEPLV
jgi:hypothetical protein